MEQEKEKDIESIFDDAKEYVDARVEYVRLSAIEKGAKIFADLITNGTAVLCFTIALLFGTITLSLFLSDILGSYTRGFGCVAGLYLLVAVIVFFVKEKYLEPKLINIFIKKYFEKVADKDDEDK